MFPDRKTLSGAKIADEKELMSALYMQGILVGLYYLTNGSALAERGKSEMRLIDADALLAFWRKNPLIPPYDHMDQVIADVKACPTVNQWTSVKDRLPELDQEVLVYAVGKIDGFIGHHVYALCNRFVQRIFSSAPGHEMWSLPWDYFHTDYEITHWMPLPEPPKEEDDD